MASRLDTNSPMLNSTRLNFLSHSNFPPTEIESIHILELISAEELRLAEIDRELALARALCQRLEREHSECASDLHRHKSVVKPIRRVPPEILREIFLRVLDLDLDFELAFRYGFQIRSPSRNKAPLLLGQICSTWRQVSIECPKLWNYIIVSFNFENHYRSLNLAEMWLDRAQALPISLVVCTKNIGVKHLSNLMDVLHPYFPRCKRLYINLVDGFIPFPTESINTILPHLQDLHLSTQGRRLIVSDVLDTLTLPALRTLYFDDSIDRSFPIDKFVALQARSHFELTSLSLAGLSLQSMDSRDLFLVIPSLVSLSLTYCTCPSKVLKALTYTERDPLLPCLQDLTIREEDDDDPSDPVFQIKDLLDMIDSRWWTDANSLLNRATVRLRKVDIEIPGRSITLSEWKRIERLQKEGLDI